MTFDRIQREGITYVNKFGIVFTPVRQLDRVMVSYNIDSAKSLGIIEAAATLTSLFRSPDKIDFMKLFGD